MKAGWEVKTLGEVTQKLETVDPRKQPLEPFTYIDVSSVSKQTLAVSKVTKLLGNAAPSRARRMVRTGDTIFATIRPTLKRIAHIGAGHDQAVCSTGYMVLRPISKLEPRFVFYYLQSANFSEAMEGLQKGASYPAVTDAEVRSQPIPLPPLAEQKRIVSILDEAFEGLDRARGNAEANLKSARELFESQLTDYFSITPKGWVSQKLNSITTKIGSGATPRGGADAYKAEGISLIRSLNVHDRWFKVDKLAFIDDGQAEKLSNVMVQEGDVLLNITGASIARCCVVPFKYLPARVNQHVSIIRPNRSALIPDFLALMLTSKPYKDRLLKTGEDNGSTRQALTKSQIQDLEVTFPQETKQQEKAVLALKAASQKTRLLSDAYQNKLQDISDLRQSLLQKAFAGELT